jgi:hypothetical protein
MGLSEVGLQKVIVGLASAPDMEDCCLLGIMRFLCDAGNDAEVQCQLGALLVEHRDELPVESDMVSVSASFPAGLEQE